MSSPALGIDSAKQLFAAEKLSIGPTLMTLMEGGTVERWHVERIPGQSVAAHSHGVAVIICFIVPQAELTARLLQAALFHDLAEKLSGDLPAPVKWDYPDMAKFLDRLSEDVEAALGINVFLSPREKVILKIADYLDAMFYCYEQRKRGNRYADPIFQRLCWFFQSIQWDYCPKAKEVWNWLEAEYQKI